MTQTLTMHTSELGKLGNFYFYVTEALVLCLVGRLGWFADL